MISYTIDRYPECIFAKRILKREKKKREKLCFLFFLLLLLFAKQRSNKCNQCQNIDASLKFRKIVVFPPPFCLKIFRLRTKFFFLIVALVNNRIRKSDHRVNWDSFSFFSVNCKTVRRDGTIHAYLEEREREARSFENKVRMHAASMVQQRGCERLRAPRHRLQVHRCPRTRFSSAPADVSRKRKHNKNKNKRKGISCASGFFFFFFFF